VKFLFGLVVIALGVDFWVHSEAVGEHLLGAVVVFLGICGVWLGLKSLVATLVKENR
jgi:hypothetical protein